MPEAANTIPVERVPIDADEDDRSTSEPGYSPMYTG
jgi:hypothetical protein